MNFAWDKAKSLANKKKHGVSFEEAARLFVSDVDYLEIFDELHSTVEERFIAIGPIARGIVLVVTTRRDDDETIRIISARWANKSEKSLFRSYMGNYK